MDIFYDLNGNELGMKSTKKLYHISFKFELLRALVATGCRHMVCCKWSTEISLAPRSDAVLSPVPLRTEC